MEPQDRAEKYPGVAGKTIGNQPEVRTRGIIKTGSLINMSLILNIDTAIETASVCLAKDRDVLKMLVSEKQKDHAAWIHPAINSLLEDTGHKIKDLNGVGVSIGPGSYTGLRVGLSTAKGLCYALNVPLLCTGTLEMMAFAARDEDADLLCPVIDARRMEVFTALYDKNLAVVHEPCAMVINEKSFSEKLSSFTILFFGNAMLKVRKIITNPRAKWGDIWGNSSHLAELNYQKFLQKKFSNLAYTEPLYMKEFYSRP
jgi:tRNA threonylcarbamoyladenosine biosynthesis protein TsaB